MELWTSTNNHGYPYLSGLFVVFCFVLFSCFGNTLHINISYMYWNLFIVHITGEVVGGIFLQFDIYPGNNYCDNVSLFAVKLA